jgi:catechol 2,3-dioxygenase-like lactoylglutathione lyase family enzyme
MARISFVALVSGAHVILYSSDAEADRAFFRDVLGLDSVDSGGGWLIFALPPAEVAVHPAEAGGRHELYLLCADLEPTLAQLQAKGVAIRGPVQEQDWGRLATIVLPGGGDLGIYQPRHPLAPHQP